MLNGICPDGEERGTYREHSGHARDIARVKTVAQIKACKFRTGGKHVAHICDSTCGKIFQIKAFKSRTAREHSVHARNIARVKASHIKTGEL